MRLTKAAEYAVRCVLYMAGAPCGAVVSRKKIAQRMDIPDAFLGKIAQQLARAGILEIRQGPRGGLRLLPPPEALSLLTVIETISGEIILNDCLSTAIGCDRHATCPVHDIWRHARQQLRATLAQADFRSLTQHGCPPDAFKKPRLPQREK